MNLFKSNSRVALQLDNCEKWLKIDNTLAKNNAVIVPIPHFFTVKQIDHMLTIVGIDTVISSKDNQEYWLSKGFKYCTTLCDSIILLERHVEDYPPLPKNTHKITFTSGTTSEPKGVCLSESHLVNVGASLAKITRKFKVKKHLCLLPLSVLLENVAANYAAKFTDIEIITPCLAEIGLSGSSTLDMIKLVETLGKYQPDSIIVMPQMLKAIIYVCEHHNVSLPFLKFIAVGGAVCSKGLLDKAKKLELPVFEGYGISECGSVISLNTSLENYGSVGKVLPHQQVKIADDGEILTKGELFLGYIGQDYTLQDWYQTGDLGRFDSNGNLSIIGRKKNVIINSFGRNISPDWLEAEISALDEIKQVAIYGDAQPFLTAICVSDQEFAVVKQAIEGVNKLLPDYAQVKKTILTKEVFSVSNHRLTASGKIRYTEVFKHYINKLENIYANTI